MLKGKDKLDTAEKVSIFLIIGGACILSLGIGLNIFGTKGLSAVLAMIGAFISFAATVALILVWLVKEILGG